MWFLQHNNGHKSANKVSADTMEIEFFLKI